MDLQYVVSYALFFMVDVSLFLCFDCDIIASFLLVLNQSSKPCMLLTSVYLHGHFCVFISVFYF